MTIETQHLSFPLEGGHKQVACISCHVEGQFADQDSSCTTCHLDDFRASQSLLHAQIAPELDCVLCHNITTWTDSTFDHSAIGFDLVGAHSTTNCIDCHVGESTAVLADFAGLSNNCIDCHQQDYDDVTDPNHIELGFPADCLQCHTEVAWTPVNFDHNTNTNFQLNGAHETASCTACHIDGVYQGTPTDCIGCHQQDYDDVADPNHAELGFPTDCLQCHTEIAWTPSDFDHSQFAFTLNGAHQTVACAECHVDNVFQGTPNNCVDCHQQDYDRVADPIHVEPSFSTNCLECHTEVAWEPSSFDHDTSTDFALNGAHINTDCISCHTDGIYIDTPNNCIDCHQQDYDGVADPNHIELSFPADCLQCHTEVSWKPANFDHDTSTDFALNGAHENLSCTDCHIDGVYTGTPTNCIDCHQTDYDGADDPDHIALGFPTDCLQCHTEIAWEPANFDHDNTNFALNGAHETVSCTDCHIGGVYEGTPTNCIDCHQDNYDEADDPIHVEPSFSTNCLECHTEVAWEPSSFDHDTSTDFALNGAHINTDCISCHIDGIYEGTPTNCNNCHQDDYNQVVEPNHSALGFPTDCIQCHTEVAWEPADFDHSQFNFALNGAHETISCTDCHIGGVYEGTPTNCVDCHQDDFANAADPIHVDAHFSTNCLECHTEVAWEPSSFEHNTSTNFALNGAHINTTCISCHTGGVYLDTPTDCVSCHAADEPRDHFGPECALCHTETAWEPSTFNHNNYFPINNGNHSDYRNDCIACHLDTSTYTTFSCIDCHDGEHQKNDMDDEHQGIRNYTYESNACLSCHPDGEE